VIDRPLLDIDPPELFETEMAATFKIRGKKGLFSILE
jgi:hypothetical protein